jgi:hypothetical protein
MDVHIAMAGHMCWIDEVRREDKGMVVSFAKGAHLFGKLSGYGGSVEFVVEHGTTRFSRKNVPYGESVDLALRVGDKAFVSQLIHDNCALQAIDRNGVEGIWLEANSSPPGLPPTTLTEFIPAN